jgi:hypothetical protein
MAMFHWFRYNQRGKWILTGYQFQPFGENMKKHQIEERIRMKEKRLAKAEAYVARNVNVEGVSFLHFDDWRGESGHLLWMKNFMIPATKKALVREEKVLDGIRKKNKDKSLANRKRRTKT